MDAATAAAAATDRGIIGGNREGSSNGGGGADEPTRHLTVSEPANTTSRHSMSPSSSSNTDNCIIETRPTSLLDLSQCNDSIDKHKQYAQGFLDALRVVHANHNFEFGGVTSPVLPQLTPTMGAITPANANDMRTIVMSILGTPLTTASTTMPPLPSPTTLPIVNSDLDLSMKFLASSALPGPQLITTSSSDPPNSKPPLTTTTSVLVPTISSLVSSPTTSTSLSDKANFSASMGKINKLSDDSDGGYSESSRCVSRSGMSRIDEMSMDEQERKKLDRKRERNRQAASKCRQKKMDRIKELEDQVAYESQKSARLDTELEQLQNVLNSFQSIVQRHSNGGCPNSMNKV